MREITPDWGEGLACEGGVVAMEKDVLGRWMHHGGSPCGGEDEIGIGKGQLRPVWCVCGGVSQKAG